MDAEEPTSRGREIIHLMPVVDRDELIAVTRGIEREEVLTIERLVNYLDIEPLNTTTEYTNAEVTLVLRSTGAVDLLHGIYLCHKLLMHVVEDQLQLLARLIERSNGCRFVGGLDVELEARLQRMRHLVASKAHFRVVLQLSF